MKEKNGPPNEEAPHLDAGEVTALLAGWTKGDPGALAKLTDKVYPELKKIALAYLSREKEGLTLQPTVLVNELFLRIVGETDFHFQDRARFYGFSARIMRRVIVDYQRARNRAKRGGPQNTKISLDAAPGSALSTNLDLDAVIAIDDAICQLEAIDEVKARILELRYFAGLEINEIAQVLDVSSRTVNRKMELAHKWLALHFTK